MTRLVPTLDLRPWAPDDPLFEPRTAWYAGDVCLTDGVEYVQVTTPASFPCETCLTPHCSDRRGTTVATLGAHVLVAARGTRPPHALSHEATLVLPDVWSSLTQRFPNLAAPLPPATRDDVLTAFVGDLPRLRPHLPVELHELRRLLLTCGDTELLGVHPWLEPTVARVRSWVQADPTASVTLLDAPEPDELWLEDGPWNGLCVGEDGRRGLAIGPLGVALD